MLYQIYFIRTIEVKQMLLIFLLQQKIKTTMYDNVYALKLKLHVLSFYKRLPIFNWIAFNLTNINNDDKHVTNCYMIRVKRTISFIQGLLKRTYMHYTIWTYIIIYSISSTMHSFGIVYCLHCAWRWFIFMGVNAISKHEI